MTPKRGDHIVVRRSLYTHHGIALGDGRVIHYTGEPGSKVRASVDISTLEDFLAGGKLTVKRHRKSLPADDVVSRAMSRYGEKGYHLVWNNCEHFAEWCKTGDSRSRQVEKVKAIVAGGATAVKQSVSGFLKKAFRKLMRGGA